MKICIVATSGISLTNFRGRLIKRWIKLGHEVTAISIEPAIDMKNIITPLGCRYIQVEGSRTGISISEGIKMIGRYIRVFKKIKPDMVYLYMSKPVAFGGIAAIFTKIKHINILVNGLENAYYRTGKKDIIVRWIMSTFYKYVGKKADNVFMQNGHDFQYFLDHGISNGENMCIVNGSGVDMSYFSEQPLPDTPVFLMTARLLWSKGIREYLNAIPKVKETCPNAHFMLVGGLDNNDESITQDELSEIITKYDVEYIGHLPDVRPMLAKCSIYVLPSYHEGTPRSVLEAMSVGRPIITTLAPGCSETVTNGENGYLVPIADVGTLALRMIELAKDRDMRKKMGRKSREICRKKFEVELVNTFICTKLGL